MKRRERGKEKAKATDLIRGGLEDRASVPRVGGGRKLGGEIKWLEGGGVGEREGVSRRKEVWLV